jgi:hypothetical protein
MSTKRKHYIKMPAPAGPRYRFILPQDLRAVKVHGLAQGILNAYEQRTQELELNAEAIKAAAIESALLIEQEIHAGKTGSNDLVVFRHTFADWCARLHIAMNTYFQDDPGIYLALRKMPDSQRVKQVFHTAEQFVEKIDQMSPDQPLVLAR